MIWFVVLFGCAMFWPLFGVVYSAVARWLKARRLGPVERKPEHDNEMWIW
jgi:hypothetical protein